MGSNQRKFIQEFLSDLSFYKGIVDGLYGGKTKAAIEDYAKSVGKEGHLKSKKMIKELFQTLITSDGENTKDEAMKKGLF